MTTTIVLGGVDLAPYTVPGSLKVSGAMGSRKTATLKLHNTGSYIPMKGTQVTMVDDGTGQVRYAGVLWSCKRKKTLGSTVFNCDLTFTDYSWLPVRKLVRGTYTSTTAGAVVQDLITKYLAELGITAGTIELGGTVTKAVYNGQTCADVLNELAAMANYVWRIDDQKRLHFQAQESYVAPWNITDAQGHFVELAIDDTLAGYRNVEVLKGSGSGISDSRLESQVGDGVKRGFAMLYPLYSVPTVTVNGAAKTVGIKDLDTGKDWYWSKSSNLITQDSSGTLLTAGDTLAVTYVGIIGVSVELEDGLEIAARAAAEGNSGRYEVLDQDTNCQYISQALDLAEVKMDQNGYDVYDIEFDTFDAGLEPGMVQQISRTDYGLETPVLITEVQGDELPAVGLPFRYTIRGVSGQKRELWLDYYKRLNGAKDYTARENETISKCMRIEETCKLSAVVSVISRPQWVWGNDGTDSSLFDGGDAMW